jgi:hypothetical protein
MIKATQQRGIGLPMFYMISGFLVLALLATWSICIWVRFLAAA